MDYTGLVKRLQVPAGWAAPTELTYGDVRAHAITRDHLRDDVAGINASIELIRRTRGGRWPTGPVTEDFNYVDLVWHECEFRENDSFTYVTYDADDHYLGCCYLYPMGRRKPLTKQLARFDVDVSWWVTPDAYAHGYYTKVYAALRHWIATEFPFTNPYYSNAEIPAATDPIIFGRKSFEPSAGYWTADDDEPGMTEPTEQEEDLPDECGDDCDEVHD